MADVTYDNVWKSFDGTVAVEDFSLEIADGEFIVLVGPSGCGKSTALRMLAGLEDASDGRIKIGDRVVNNVAPADRDVAMVFQSYALYPHMTVFDNLAFALRNMRVPKREIAGARRAARARSSSSRRCSSASRSSSPAASASASRSGARSCASRSSSSWTSRSPTSTPSFAWRPARRSSSCRSGWRRRPSTSRTTRSRR